MAAFLTVRPLSSRTASPVAAFFPTSRLVRRRSIELAGTFTTIWSVTREWLLLLWMLGVVAFSFLVAAGALGLLR
jgi:hypothetical protein